jgi:hypothetical protein
MEHPATGFEIAERRRLAISRHEERTSLTLPWMRGSTKQEGAVVERR